MKEQLRNIEIQKDLLKSGAIAVFSHYCFGSLYYNVKFINGIYQFPVSTVVNVKPDTNCKLSPDLGKTTFDSNIKGSSLFRWIRIANENGHLIKIS